MSYLDNRQFREHSFDYPKNRPYENKDMVIFKFDWHRIKKDSYKNAELMTKFKIAFINQFSPMSWESLIVYTLWQKTFHEMDPVKYPDEMIPYEKYWLFDQYEIGLDLIHKQYGVRCEHHWSSWYVLVPKKEIEIIKWMSMNQPPYVTIKKRI